MTKCYFGGAVDYFDHEFVEACFAPDRKSAKQIMWEKSYRLADECDGEWHSARVIRQPEHDKLLDQKRTGAYVVNDDKILREMGWGLEGDTRCTTCGLSDFNGKWTVCDDCGQCCECGHDQKWCSNTEPSKENI